MIDEKTAGHFRYKTGEPTCRCSHKIILSMDQHNSKLNTTGCAILISLTFSFVIQHPNSFDQNVKKHQATLIILKTTSLLRQDFMAQKSL